jgi:hypothetical protein
VGFAEAGAVVALHYHHNSEGVQHTLNAVSTAGAAARFTRPISPNRRPRRLSSTRSSHSTGGSTYW